MRRLLVATWLTLGVVLGLVSQKGRAEAVASAAGRVRRPNVKKFYGRRLSDVEPGGFEFRLSLRGGGSVVPLDRFVEAFDWTDGDASLTGTVTLRRERADEAIRLLIGQRVRCEVRWRGSWYDLWEMGVQSPKATDLPEGQQTLTLQDDLILLHRTRRAWSFRRTARRKKGWYAHEIVAEVARVTGLKVGALARGTVRMDRLVRGNASALDVIRAAYQFERDRSGRRFIIRLRNGRLEVVTLQRNTVLYEFEREIQAAHLEETQRANPFTVLHGTGRIGDGARARKVSYTHAERSVVTKLGRVEREKDYGKVTGLRDLVDQVKRDYAAQLRVKFTASITVPCVPFLRRGDGIRWVTTEPGWHGGGYTGDDNPDHSFVYCLSVQHTVNAGGQTTDIDLTQTDPYFEDAKRKDAEARAAKDRLSAGSGDWIIVGATVFGDTSGAYGGTLSGGYAELGTAGHNAYLGPLLAPLFGIGGELPENFVLQVRNPTNGRVVTVRKRDRGSGQADDRHYKIDLHDDVAIALGLGTDFKGDVEIRRG